MRYPKRCEKCRDPFVRPTNGNPGTGYGVQVKGTRKHYLCYRCCAELEKEHMRKTGRGVLYFTYSSPCHNPRFTSSGVNLTASDYKVSNWMGLISITPMKVSVGKHNMARRKWSCWFAFEGSVWYGYQVGENTDLLHCRRTQQRAA